tara:strand:- start:250 stop:465 length:216 start_codon:yes stop_codon:yes gene_type:complete
MNETPKNLVLEFDEHQSEAIRKAIKQVRLENSDPDVPINGFGFDAGSLDLGCDALCVFVIARQWMNAEWSA